MQTNVDQLVERFHCDRNSIAQDNRNDVAVVFVNSHVAAQLKDTGAVDVFRQTAAQQLFVPFDRVAQYNVEDAICYVLRSNSSRSSGDARNSNCNNVGGDFEPYYCQSGSLQGATMHYRVEFEILVRKLFEKNYKYIMKPIVVERCVMGSNTSAKKRH